MNSIKMIGYAFAQIIDSIVIICTLGFVTTTIPFRYLCWWEIRDLKKQIEKNKNDKANEQI